MQISTRSAARLRERGEQSDDGLTVEQYRRLSWFKATYVASGHLQRAGLEHDANASRHLAFGLWLKATGRLDGEFAVTSADQADGAARPFPGRWRQVLPRHENNGGKAA